MDEQTSAGNRIDIRTTVESPPGAAITVLRIEVPQAIKAAISARIAAEKQGNKAQR